MTRRIAFVLFPGAEELDFVGPWEVFTMLAQLQRESCECYFVSEHGGEVKCAKGMRVLTDYSYATAPAPDIVVVPGGFATRTERENPATVAWVKQAAANAEVAASVCTGSQIFARAGLLAGKRATSYWNALKELEDLDSTITVVGDERWVDEGAVISAAGVSAGIDMSLHLIGRLWSPETARLVQLAVEYFPAPPYQDVPLPVMAR